MNKKEQLGNYEAQNDQPQELQEELGRRELIGDTLSIPKLEDILRMKKRLGGAALNASELDAEEA